MFRFPIPGSRGREMIWVMLLQIVARLVFRFHHHGFTIDLGRNKIGQVIMDPAEIDPGHPIEFDFDDLFVEKCGLEVGKNVDGFKENFPGLQGFRYSFPCIDHVGEKQGQLFLHTFKQRIIFRCLPCVL